MTGLNTHTAKKPSGYVDRPTITGLLLAAWFCSTIFVPSLPAAEATNKEPEGKVVFYSTFGGIVFSFWIFDFGFFGTAQDKF